MNDLDKLQQLLSKLPGIGPRQARRFAFFLMQSQQSYINDLTQTIDNLRQEKQHCSLCNRVFFVSHTHRDTNQCPTCADESRDKAKLLIVAKQADFENINNTHLWTGYYYIMNKTLRLSDKHPEETLALPRLLARLDDFNLDEIVIGLPLNPEGEYTASVLEDAIAPLVKERGLTISHLARGLSRGSELEYSDPQTLESALHNRS